MAGIELLSGTRQEFRFPQLSKVLTTSATKFATFDEEPKECRALNDRAVFEKIAGLKWFSRAAWTVARLKVESVGSYRIKAISCVAELVKSFDFPSFRKS